MKIEDKRKLFERWYRENDSKYLNVLDRYEHDIDFYPNNDYIQMRYKLFCAGIDSFIETQQRCNEFSEDYFEPIEKAMMGACDE